MLYPNVNNQSPDPYQDRTVPAPVQQPPQYNEDTYYESTPSVAPQPGPQNYSGPQGPAFNAVEPVKQQGWGLRTGAIIGLTVLLAIVFGTGLFAGWQFGRGGAATLPASNGSSALQPSGNARPTIPALTDNNIQTVREKVVAAVKPTVVQINVTTAQGSGLGSGVIIDKRGYIVTNNHVVNGARTVEVVLYNGTKLTGQVVGTDPADDLAIVKINPPTNMAVATLGDSSKLSVGQEVLAIGNPLGITQTVTHGIVSALNRSVPEGQNSAVIPDAIQTDAPINPGNSGGALVDLQGNLVGIPTLTAIDPEFRTPANGVGFAIPSNRVQLIASQIIQDGKVTHTGRAALGIGAIEVTPDVANQENLAVDHGVMIGSVVKGSAAQKAGLQVGDVIVQIGDVQVVDRASLSGALLAKNPGETVQVKIFRGNQQMTVNVTLGELQAS